MAETGRLIDISLPIHVDMPVFEGNPSIALERQQSLAEGDEANVSNLSLGVHTGTHVDAPLHFLDEGDAVHQMSLDALIGQAYVLDATSVAGHLGETALRGLGLPEDCRRLLVKTRNSGLWEQGEFRRDFQGLTSDGAGYLVQRGIRLVGWDYLSIGPFGDAVETHRVLLEAGVVILEGIDLHEVTAGEYELLCLPLRLVGGDGSPARAILRAAA